MTPLLGKLIAHSRIDSETGCWIWTGAFVVSRSGRRYGRVRDGRRVLLVHRAAFELFKGPLSGECDHRCEETLCFNPDHLRDMTPSQNRWNLVRDPSTQRYVSKRAQEAEIEELNAALEASI